MASVQKRLQELLELSREERSELAEALLESLDDSADAEVMESWAAEIMRRISTNESGSLPSRYVPKGAPGSRPMVESLRV